MSRFARRDSVSEADGEARPIAIGEIQKYTFSFQEYINRHSITISDVAVTETASGIVTVSGVADVNGIVEWTAEGKAKGETNLKFTVTTSDPSRKPIGIVKMNVYDPEEV